MAAHRVSFIKAGGWTRLGVAGAAAVLFSAPMLWALGSFGFAEEAIHRAIIYALSGTWCLLAFGYLVGWAVQGFVIRQKVVEEEDEDARPSAPPPSRPAPPPSRSGGH
jgi:hypothetical protein